MPGGHFRLAFAFYLEEFLVGTVAHGQLQFAAGQHLVVSELGSGELFTIDGSCLDVLFLPCSAISGNSKGLAVGQVDLYLVEDGAADVILAAGGIDGVEAHGGEHQEGAHCAAVFVAADA